ncbi:MAG: tryptophanyl-tRNA synthetase, tryptophanyl-tRNA synthetase [Candidatus Saccharibacteria bacterium]|nr:tryptophanyl-tRNA synthetase, tryptophanyl-tRNA synthetase [Candidatus Saccharibacteria bacterium]
MAKPVVLTGLRANSEFHLGNYLGGILPMIQLQKKFAGDYQLNMFVPDLHSFTTPVEHSKLYLQIIDNLKVYVAAGLDLDNEDTFIYRQSYVAGHSELAVILNNFAYFGELQRMTQFKEKSDQAKDTNITAGLFDYPVLMAADILLYGAKWIPVGEDQRQHIELTRDIALRMNNKFGEDLLHVPVEWEEQLKFAGRESGVRIRSLKTPEKKMSKSVDDPAGTILLSDNPEDAAKKVMSATTDSIGVIRYDMKNQAGISNLLQILALLIDAPLAEVIANWEGKTSYGDLKTAVASEVKVFLTDFQRKLANVEEPELMRKLEASEYLMRDVATQNLYKIQQAVGLRP